MPAIKNKKDHPPHLAGRCVRLRLALLAVANKPQRLPRLRRCPPRSRYRCFSQTTLPWLEPPASQKWVQNNQARMACFRRASSYHHSIDGSTGTVGRGPLQPSLYKRNLLCSYRRQRIQQIYLLRRKPRREQRSWTVCPKNILGRLRASSSGRLPNIKICAMVLVITSGIGGQPGMLIMGLIFDEFPNTYRSPVG
jgi:hypothetical protein